MGSNNMIVLFNHVSIMKYMDKFDNKQTVLCGFNLKCKSMERFDAFEYMQYTSIVRNGFAISCAQAEIF